MPSEMVTTFSAWLKQLPTKSRKYVVYVTALTVALSIGLAPLLGVRKVPAIGELFPLNMQKAAAAFAAFLMTLPAVGVEFFAGDKFNKQRLTKAFTIVFAVLFAVVLALYVTYTVTVAHVELGADLSAAYVVGGTMLPDCPCAAKKLQISSCIGPVLDTNPAHVEDCYPRADIVARKNILSLLYLLMMFSLGVLIGLVVVRDQLTHRQKRSAKRA